MKLSQILKYAGIVVAALGALKIVYAEVEIFQVHWICMIIIGLGALTWFAGDWEAKHEAAVAKALITPLPTTTSSATTVVVPTTTTTNTVA